MPYVPLNYKCDMVNIPEQHAGRGGNMAEKSKSTIAAGFKKNLPVYILMLPGLLYFLFNNYLPMAGIIIAFKNINFRKGILQSPWAGLDNFEFLFAQGDTVFIITRNTVLYNVVFIILGLVMSVLTAILLNEIKNKFTKSLYQTLILLPYLISWVVISYLAYAFLNGDTGYINTAILPALGIEDKIAFYQQKAYWPFILIFINQWKNIGFGTVIYLANIVGISPALYEAAKIDGASKRQQIKAITLPLLKPTMITLTVLNIGRMFYSDFGLFYQIPRNSGIIYDVTQTIDTYVYNALMRQNNISMSSAASVYQSIVGAILVILANQLIRKLSKENALF